MIKSDNNQRKNVPLNVSDATTERRALVLKHLSGIFFQQISHVI